MKRIVQILLLAGLMSLTSGLLYAQEDIVSRELTSNYDKAKNETEIKLEVNGIENSDGKTIVLSVSVSFPGEKLSKRPKDVIFITAIASNGGYKYPDMMAMKVKADGKDLPDVLMLNLDRRPMDEQFLETIGTRMKFDVFKKLAQAKRAELKLHQTTITIDAADLAKFAEILKLIDP